MSIIPGSSGSPASFPDGFLVSDGTVTAPTFRFSDTQTGFYRPSVNAVALTSAGVQTLLVSSGGAFTINPTAGLGTGAAAYNLAYGSLVLRNGTNARGSISANDVIQLGVNVYRDGAGALRATTTATGCAFIEMTRNGIAFDLYSSNAAQTADTNVASIASIGSASLAGAWTLGLSANITHTVQAAPSAGAALYVSNLSATASSSSRGIDVAFNGDANCTGGRFVNCVNSSGTTIAYCDATSNTTASWVDVSDARIKQDIKTFNGLSMVLQMEAVDYELKNTDGYRQKGFIAQDLYQVFPDAVSVGSDDVTEDGNLRSPWGVSYGRLTPVLVKAIQELNAKVEALEAQLNA